MARKHFFMVGLFLSLSCMTQVLFASHTQENGLFTAQQVRAAFDRDNLQGSQLQGGVLPIIIAEPAARIERPLSSTARRLSELIESDQPAESCCDIVNLHPFFVKTIDLQVIIPKKIGDKKRLLKQSKQVLINPALDQVAIYEQAYKQGVSDAQTLIERYAEILLKDELPVLKQQVSDAAHKDGYDTGYKAAQEKFQQEKEDEPLKKKSKIEKKNGFLTGAATGGFVASAACFYSKKA